jgi:uncharacterized membrane protein YqjE
MSPSEFDSLIDNLKKLPGELKSLFEKRIELFTIEVGERISNLVTHAIYRLTGVAFLALGLILVLFAASNFVGDLLDNEGLGFIIVSAPILIIGILLFLRRPRFMVNATRDKLLNQFLKDLAEQISNIEPDFNGKSDKQQDSDNKSEQSNDGGKKPQDS